MVFVFMKKKMGLWCSQEVHGGYDIDLHGKWV